MLDTMAGKNQKLADTLQGRTIQLQGEDNFVIQVSNSFVEAEIRPHLREMLETMRVQSGRKNLNCQIQVIHQEREAIIYSPRDKYEAMAKNNPTLQTLRILLPEVDL